MINNKRRYIAYTCKLVFINLLAGMLVFFIVSGVAAELPSTNEQFVSESIANAAVDFFDSLRLVPSQIEIMSSDGLNMLVIKALKSAVVGSGWLIISARPAGARLSADTEHDTNKVEGQYYKIIASLSAFDFKYKKGKSRGIFNKPNVRRELSGQILIDLSGPGCSYVNFKEFSGSDEVSPQYKNYIASVRYKELSPPVKIGGAERYLEPLAVTAAIGGLIYLFFINR